MNSIAVISDFQKLQNFEQKYSLEKQKVEYPKIISKFTSSSFGAKKFFKIGVINCSWLIKFSNILKLNIENVQKIVDVKKKLYLVHKTLTIAKFPQRIIKVNNNYQNYLKKELDTTRTRDKLLQKTIKVIQQTSLLAQLGEIYCLYTFGPFSNKILRFYGKFFLFLSSCFKLKMNAEDYIEHGKIQKIANNKKIDSRLKTILYEINNLNLIKIIKCIASVAIGIFFLIEFIFAVAIVSPIVMLILSTISVSFSVWSHLYKDSMSYPEIQKTINC